jgi:hypothetical protein
MIPSKGVSAKKKQMKKTKEMEELWLGSWQAQTLYSVGSADWVA